MNSAVVSAAHAGTTVRRVVILGWKGTLTVVRGAIAGAEAYGDHVFVRGGKVESARIGALAEELDPLTLARLRSLGIGSSWTCLELAAGTGTVARHLASLCPRGRVVATDLDVTRLLRDTPPNLTMLRHDVARESFPEQSFDLVHARYLFCHLRERDEVLRRVVRWLKPGGWLCVEEPDDSLVASSVNEPHRTVGVGMAALLAERIGTDGRWSRRLASMLDSLGLTDIDVSVTGSVVGGRGPMTRFWRLTIEQLAPEVVERGYASAAQVTEVLAQISDDEFRGHGLSTVSVLARAPIRNLGKEVS